MQFLTDGLFKNYEWLTDVTVLILCRDPPDLTRSERSMYKFAFHVAQYQNINYIMGWGLQTNLKVEALKLS